MRFIVPLALMLVAQPVHGQVIRVPTAVGITTPVEIEAGQPINVEVTLRNYRNELVAALADTRVKIQVPSSGRVVDALIPKGKTSAAVTVPAPDRGLVRLDASSPQLSGKSMLLLVKPSAKPAPFKAPVVLPEVAPNMAPAIEYSKRSAINEVQPERERSSISESRGAWVSLEAQAERRGLGERTASLPEPAPPFGGALPVSPLAPAKIAMEAIPQEVYQQNGAWETELVMVLLTADDRVVPAAEELRIQLTALFGKLASTELTIPQGAVRTPAVKLTSTMAGTDSIRARSALGTSELKVTYHVPRPSQIRVVPNPIEVVNSGKMPITATVLLLDQANNPTSFGDRDLDVVINSSLGVIAPRESKIPSQRFYTEAILTSAQHGEATVAVHAMGFPSATATVRFMFPWVLVLLSGGGGVIGAFVRTRQASLSKDWFKNALANVAVGSVLGLFFYLVALFGVFAKVPTVQLPIAVEDVPTVNELGALLIGFVGGIVGRSFWMRE